jgi:large subunit ribosomal protein L13
MKMTHSAKSADIQRAWHVVDATDQPLGRLSSEIAKVLRGKTKAAFTPHADVGDNVIVINAAKVKLTGRKTEQMTFYWHTGFPGGIKDKTAREELEGRFPERLVERAVERMMPKDSPLSRDMMRKLHVYAGAEHPHAAQQPTPLDLAAKIRKTNRSK